MRMVSWGVATLLALLSLGNCSTAPAAGPGGAPGPAVSPEQPLRLAAWPAGANAVTLRYRWNGGPWSEARFVRPAQPGAPAAAARPDYPRSWPAVVLDWQWVAHFPEGREREVAAGSAVHPGLFTAVPWQVQRGRRVLLFTSPGGPAVPGVPTLEQEYRRLVELLLANAAAAPPVVSLYVFPSTAEYDRFSAAAHTAAGVAEINLRRAYTDRIDSPRWLQQVLVHEMAHLIAGEFSLGWATEGVARLAEAPYQPAGHFAAVLERTGLRIDARGGAVDLGTAAGPDMYDLGYVFLTYLRDRYGNAPFRQLLAVARAERGDLEAAMPRVLGKGRKALEAEFGQAVLARLAGDTSHWYGLAKATSGILDPLLADPGHGRGGRGGERWLAAQKQTPTPPRHPNPRPRCPSPVIRPKAGQPAWKWH